MDEATRTYLTTLQNPYAKLSFLDPGDPQAEDLPSEAWWELLWKSKSQIYQFVADALALESLQTRPPATLREFATRVLKMGPRAQHRLQQRVFSYLPEIPVARNRLSKRDQERVLQKI